MCLKHLGANNKGGLATKDLTIQKISIALIVSNGLFLIHHLQWIWTALETLTITEAHCHNSQHTEKLVNAHDKNLGCLVITETVNTGVYWQRLETGNLSLLELK